jgi:hypothetical protein
MAGAHLAELNGETELVIAKLREVNRWTGRTGKPSLNSTCMSRIRAAPA